MLLNRSRLNRNLQNFRKVKFCISSFLSLFAFIFLVTNNAAAEGDLMVTPNRLVFDGNKRSIDLNLANTGKDSATYEISLVQIRMKEDGSFETITLPDPGQNFADQNLRFFPHMVTLPPNVAQVVKVQLLSTNKLQPGEYRSHFYFRSVPKIKPLGEKEAVKDSNIVSVSLTPIFGITIPAIIRVGESTPKVSLSDMKLAVANDGNQNLTMTFNRTGNFSVFGDLSVDYVSPQGKVTHVGKANGIAVYTPNSGRRFQLNLDKGKGVDFKSGKLLLVYSSSTDVKPAKLAEAELVLR